ncbi:hypothetical protein A3709_10435 [Halioglobus sp. HI00S01]|uniref:GumC family protein n=1 Tax=Halioglobus sp. HI00S01 TaxID=1822214 RepID=UPI0007C24CD6|nr:polysaccharide biosynthesis tyrosine autokinase [Halioglobus sp. HI00S01]KZX51239.1 hypothetical protein A3709_10435 [Halioglobus sp. HI00S01]
MNQRSSLGSEELARQQAQVAVIQTSPETSEDDLIDLKKVWRAVFRYKWGIVGLSILFGLITAMYVSTIEPVYRASATLLLESREANLVGVEDIYSSSYRAYDYYTTQFEILKSRSIAERVVRNLELHKRPEFQPGEKKQSGFSLQSLLPAREQSPPVQLSPAEREKRLIDQLTGYVAGGLVVEQVDYTHMAHLSFNSTSPRLAADIVNAMAEEFIAANLEARVEGTLQATGWLSERLSVLKKNLRDSEQALHDFREMEGLVHIDGETNLGGNELAGLSQRLEDARRSRIEAQNIKADIQNMPGASTEELMALPAVLKHPLIGGLKRSQSEAERRVAELSMRYGPKHPVMISARSDLQVANEDLRREVRKVISGISLEYEIALRNEQQLQVNWESRKKELQEFNRVEFDLQELERDVETNRQLYDLFFTRIRGVSEGGGFEKPHARIVDRARVPASPHSPNVKRAAVIAAVLGLVLGAAVAAVIELIDYTIKQPDDVQNELGVPLLGTLPLEKTKGESTFPAYWHEPQGRYAEAIRTIRTGVLLSELDEPEKIILVTSTVPGEGKSTLVLNLGAALAQMERILIIGADLRRPSLAQKCGLEPGHLGLSHYVSGTAELEECISELEDSGIWAMPAGVIPPNPLEMISSKKFENALSSLKGQFDRILIDSAPVQAVSDALVLAAYADAVVYVVKAGSTHAGAIKKGIGGLLTVNKSLNGVVLNQFDSRRADQYFANGGYYQYGGYSQEQA